MHDGKEKRGIDRPACGIIGIAEEQQIRPRREIVEQPPGDGKALLAAQTVGNDVTAR